MRKKRCLVHNGEKLKTNAAKKTANEMHNVKNKWATCTTLKNDKVALRLALVILLYIVCRFYVLFLALDCLQRHCNTQSSSLYSNMDRIFYMHRKKTASKRYLIPRLLFELSLDILKHVGIFAILCSEPFIAMIFCWHRQNNRKRRVRLRARNATAIYDEKNTKVNIVK